MDNSNVFILSSDSLSQSYFGGYLNNIADVIGAVNFTNAITTASDTNSAMPSLAASVYSDTIPGWGLPEDDTPETFATVLSAEGYECGLWTDNHLTGPEYNYDRGFEERISDDKNVRYV
jgi:arylsulfatase A-like enzyme